MEPRVLNPLAKMIDHTSLKPEATPKQLKGFVPKHWNIHLVRCASILFTCQEHKFSEEAPVAVCTVVGFPLEAVPTAAKVFEAERAIGKGAIEIDMVLSIGLLKAGMALK